MNKLVRSLPSVLSYSIGELDSSLGVLQLNYTFEITLQPHLDSLGKSIEH